MIGLSVNAGNKTDAEFKKYLAKRMEQDANGTLDGYLKEGAEPYAYELRYESRSRK